MITGTDLNKTEIKVIALKTRAGEDTFRQGIHDS